MLFIYSFLFIYIIFIEFRLGLCLSTADRWHRAKGCPAAGCTGQASAGTGTQPTESTAATGLFFLVAPACFTLFTVATCVLMFFFSSESDISNQNVLCSLAPKKLLFWGLLCLAYWCFISHLFHAMVSLRKSTTDLEKPPPSINEASPVISPNLLLAAEMRKCLRFEM